MFELKAFCFALTTLLVCGIILISEVNMILENKVAFITGAGGGIGRATALALAKEGARVVLFGGNNLQKLDETAQAIRALNIAEPLIFAGNLCDDKVMEEIFARAVSAVGSIDILINNAGMALSSPFEQTDMAIFDKIMNINVRVPYKLTQLALPLLKKSDSASIINLCSVVSHAGYALQSAYTASKHALLGFTKSLASEVYDQGVRVHAISPGGVYTDMVKVSRPDLTPDGMILPEDIAQIVMFFLSNRGNAVVDEILVHRVNKAPFLV